jgi:cellulose biosynthesis protein BcsQ
VPAILYDAKSKGAEAYLSLARELLTRGTSAPPAEEQQHG